MSLSAASALALASAFWAAVGSTAPASVTGATSIIQTWRVSGVVASSCSLASMSAGAALTPSCAASDAWSLVSMMRSSAIDATLFFCWVMVDSAEVPCASVR